MKNICFYFQLHQPVRLKKYKFFQIGQDHYYYDDFQIEERIRNVVEQSYLPANQTIHEIIRTSNGKFKCTFSISGVVLEQLERYAPEVIDSFKELAATGSVDFLTEPYAHSLSSVFDENEFEMQVKKHAAKIQELFKIKPTAFRNTEMIYSDEIGQIVSKMGFKTMLIEEAKHIMGWKSTNYVYAHSYIPKLKLLVRNTKLSEDISQRFSDFSWSEYPLTAEKYVDWISNTPENDKIFNIWMGYETLGVGQHENTGIFNFLRAVPYFAMEKGISFATPSEITKKNDAVDILSVPYPMSWWGHEKDLSAWNGNDLQNEAISKLYAVGERVRMSKDKPLLRDWLLLQTTEHFRYMSHKHAFESPYESAYEAFMNYMNILADFLERVDEQFPTTIENEELNELLKTINQQEEKIQNLETDIKKLKSKKATTTKVAK